MKRIFKKLLFQYHLNNQSYLKGDKKTKIFLRTCYSRNEKNFFLQFFLFAIYAICFINHNHLHLFSINVCIKKGILLIDCLKNYFRAYTYFSTSK